jgi:serine/threonine protein kinase
LINFNAQDIFESAKDVLSVLITMADTRGLPKNIFEGLPRESTILMEREEQSFMLQSDPSQVYDIVGKLGQGGFAKVFKVKRREDGFLCALKFIEPKS